MSICCICLEKVGKVKPYECNHYIHMECANKWNKDCPLCKSKLAENIKSIRNKNYKFCIGETFGYEVTLAKYKLLWDKTKCIRNVKDHKVVFSKPYGIVGRCNCGSIQSFNWIH